MHCITSRLCARLHQHLDLQSRFSCSTLHQQPYSSGPLISAQTDETRLSVKVGLKSYVPLTIHHAPRPTANGPVIVYLPAGPGVVAPSPYPPLRALALSSNATVVCIHYRLSAEDSYPTPIHDVLAGYDWVLENFARKNLTVDHARQVTTSTSVGVCGEWIGGGLSTMLALTECRATSDGVKAAAVGNPITDWTSLFSDNDSTAPTVASESIHTIRSSAKQVTPRTSSALRSPSPSADAMLDLRSRLFPRPEKYFDPFASPLLFFRTPASDLPNDTNFRGAISGFVASEYSTDNGASSISTKKRRSHRKYPPSGSGFRLPYLRFQLGTEYSLREQGEAMVDVLGKSVKYWEEESYGALAKEALSRRIQLVERDGLGWWAEKEIRELGAWFGDVLRR